MRRDSCRYESVTHSHVIVVDRRIHFAKLDLHHETYTSVDDCWRKLLRYTEWEAQDRRAQRFGDAHIPSNRPKNGWAKALYRRLPAKPLLIFTWRYFIKLGFLDGRRGLHLAMWSAVYYDIVRARVRYDSGGVVKQDAR